MHARAFTGVDLPEGRCIEVTQYRAGSARQNRGHPSGLGGPRRMSYGINTRVSAMKPPARQAPAHRRAPNSECCQLAAGHHSMLPCRQLRKPHIGV
jgi:hypothetical protein